VAEGDLGAGDAAFEDHVADGRDPFFASDLLQDATLRNLQTLCCHNRADALAEITPALEVGLLQLLEPALDAAAGRRLPGVMVRRFVTLRSH